VVLSGVHANEYASLGGGGCKGGRVLELCLRLPVRSVFFQPKRRFSAGIKWRDSIDKEKAGPSYPGPAYLL
jgi:hypothetical protein